MATNEKSWKVCSVANMTGVIVSVIGDPKTTLFNSGTFSVEYNNIFPVNKMLSSGVRVPRGTEATYAERSDETDISITGLQVENATVVETRGSFIESRSKQDNDKVEVIEPFVYSNAINALAAEVESGVFSDNFWRIKVNAHGHQVYRGIESKFIPHLFSDHSLFTDNTDKGGTTLTWANDTLADITQEVDLSDTNTTDSDAVKGQKLYYELMAYKEHLCSVLDGEKKLIISKTLYNIYKKFLLAYKNSLQLEKERIFLGSQKDYIGSVEDGPTLIGIDDSSVPSDVTNVSCLGTDPRAFRMAYRVLNAQDIFIVDNYKPSISDWRMAVNESPLLRSYKMTQFGDIPYSELISDQPILNEGFIPPPMIQADTGKITVHTDRYYGYYYFRMTSSVAFIRAIPNGMSKWIVPKAKVGITSATSRKTSRNA